MFEPLQQVEKTRAGSIEEREDPISRQRRQLPQGSVTSLRSAGQLSDHGTTVYPAPKAYMLPAGEPSPRTARGRGG